MLDLAAMLHPLAQSSTMTSRHDDRKAPDRNGDAPALAEDTAEDAAGRTCAHLGRVVDDDGALWRTAIDALAFRPPGHDGFCAVHRLAFRALLGRTGMPADCLAYFTAHRPAFERAAAEKIARRGLDSLANLHLTSRDVVRAIAHLAADG